MVAHNDIIKNDSALDNPSAKGDKFKSKMKEWFRKKIVNLKRRPQTIPLLLFVITTVFFMLALVTFSQSVYSSNSDARTPATGICIFISTLLSLLVLVSFLNAFPKRKKPVIAFIVLVYLMVAGMIACDIVYYSQMQACIEFNGSGTMVDMVSKGQPLILVHIVLLGISAVVFALLPVYSRLIKKIDTSIKIESATENMQGQIDIED